MHKATQLSLCSIAILERLLDAELTRCAKVQRVNIIKLFAPKLLKLHISVFDGHNHAHTQHNDYGECHN
jgi:hypothetical protein